MWFAAPVLAVQLLDMPLHLSSLSLPVSFDALWQAFHCLCPLTYCTHTWPPLVIGRAFSWKLPFVVLLLVLWASLCSVTFSWLDLFVKASPLQAVRYSYVLYLLWVLSLGTWLPHSFNIWPSLQRLKWRLLGSLSARFLWAGSRRWSHLPTILGADERLGWV